MYLIVGLGNPGRRYEGTRHNIGFAVIDSLAEYLGVKLDKVKFKGIFAKTNYKNEKIILLKPETYMNASGDSVKPFIDYFGIDIEKVIVIVDDIDIKFGTVRIRKNGSAGTHNGLKSIIQRTGNKDFPRVKVAVNQKPSYMDLADFVMSKFSASEQKIILKEIEIARDAILDIIEKDVDSSMNKYNPIIVE